MSFFLDIPGHWEGDPTHRIEITEDRELVLHDHDLEAEKIAVQLGANKDNCLLFHEAWHQERSRTVVLLMYVEEIPRAVTGELAVKIVREMFPVLAKRAPFCASQSEPHLEFFERWFDPDQKRMTYAKMQTVMREFDDVAQECWANLQPDTPEYETFEALDAIGRTVGGTYDWPHAHGLLGYVEKQYVRMREALADKGESWPRGAGPRGYMLNKLIDHLKARGYGR